MVKISSQRAPLSYKKRPLGTWPETKKHQETESLEEEGAQSRSGHEPDPEKITGADQSEPKTNLDAAKDAGLYANQDEEHPGEINIAEEEDKDIQTKEE